MPIEEWEKQPNGNLVVSHLLAWEAIVAPLAGAVRLQTATTKGQVESGNLAVLQLALDAKQLRDLGEAFLRMAVDLESKAAATQQ